MYTVFDQGNGLMRINNAETDTQVGQITTRGEIQTPPIVNGDRVSFVVKTPAGKKIGNGNVILSDTLFLNVPLYKGECGLPDKCNG